MMGSRGTKGGDEYDALAGPRHRYAWQRGILRKIKRKFWRRQRMETRAGIRRDMAGETDHA
jgi:hypothetical protein